MIIYFAGNPGGPRKNNSTEKFLREGPVFRRLFSFSWFANNDFGCRDKWDETLAFTKRRKES